MLSPMLAKRLEVPNPREALEIIQAGATHVGEPKYDGIRATVHIQNGKVVSFTNYSTDYPGDGDLRRRFPELVKGIPSAFPEGEDLLLDGEVGLLHPSGLKMDYNAVQHRARKNSFDIDFHARTTPMSFAVFDILRLRGDDLWRRPYRERRETLAPLVRASPRVRLVPVSTDLLGLYDHVSGLGGEGVMVKRLDAPYRPDERTDAWWKAKSATYVDNLEVVGLLEGNGGLEGNVGALVIARRNAQGVLEHVCNAGSGLNDHWRRDLLKAATRLGRGDCPIDPEPKLDRPVLSWLNPGIRADIHYEEPVVTKEKKRTPRFPVVRNVSIPQ